MSETKPFAVTVKTPESERFKGDNPWFVFEGTVQQVGAAVIEAFQLENVNPTASVAEIVLAAQATLVALATAERGLNSAPAAPQQLGATPQVAQQPQGWGAAPPPQQQAAPTGKVNGAPHPEGKTCPACGAGVVFKRTNPRKTDGKTFEFWTCPNQSAKGDGHFSAFAD